LNDSLGIKTSQTHFPPKHQNKTFSKELENKVVVFFAHSSYNIKHQIVP